MTRGFSLIEILISLTVLTTTLIAISLLTLGAPDVLANAVLHREAGYIAQQGFLKEMARGPEGFLDAASYEGTNNVFSTGVLVETVGDGSAKHVQSRVSWNTIWDIPQTLVMDGYVTDYMNADQYACSPFLRRHAGSEPSLEPFTAFPLPHIASLAANRAHVVVSASSTPGFSDSTLFVFDTKNSTETPLSFDTATSTKIGYGAVAVHGDYVYALSAHACPVGVPCAALDVLLLQDAEIVRVHSLPLPPTRSITYAHGYLFVGLRASSMDPEFQVFSLENPELPVQVGSAEIGSTVNDIVSNGSTVYIATADNSIAGDRAVMAFPLSSFNASMQASMRARPPGAGISQTLALSGEVLYIGRSAPLNSKELYLLSATYLGEELSSWDIDSSVYGIVAQGTHAYVLTKTHLERWNVENPRDISQYSSYTLPQGATGGTVACGGSGLFVAANDSGGGHVLRLGL
jgi:hypothetical protein